MCGLGRLYSKQSIIEQLLDKEQEMPDSCKHIKSLKDVKNLVLSPNPSYEDTEKTEGLLDVRSAPYICKLIGLEMSGKFRFVALWTCGCVFSERALKEIGSKVCSLCQTPFEEADVVILNGNEEEVDAMVVKMEVRNARRKASKKEKSARKAAAAATITGEVSLKQENCDGNSTSKSAATSTIKLENIKKEKLPAKAAAGSSKDVAERLAKRNAASDALLDPEMKKLREDASISVSKDPKKSEIYKSLFTTHHTHHEQDRAHWVTYNPFYN